jgi:hypothetical protein
MKKIILFALVAITLASCSTPKTMGEQYAAMYDEKPVAIAVMPPINRTTHAEAKDYFYTTMYLPLCEKGYYVYSPYLTMEMFQQESAYDAEMFLENDLTAFRNVLGADAVMFTIIKDWRRNNVGGKLKVISNTFFGQQRLDKLFIKGKVKSRLTRVSILGWRLWSTCKFDCHSY